jgi:histone-lysine N-methyltransferase SUV420H
MDLGDEFAFDAAGEEDELEGEDGEEGDDADDDDPKSRTRDVRTESVVDEANDTPSKRNRRRKEARGARRSDRTKRRDFSIVWSGLKRCYQLFLGPARFLNVSYIPLIPRAFPRHYSD